MRILSVNPAARDAAGGAAGATIRLNEHLRALGHEVDELFYEDITRIRDVRLGLDLLPLSAARQLRRVARRYDVVDAVGHAGALLFRLWGRQGPLRVFRTVGLDHVDYDEARRDAEDAGTSIGLKTRLHHGVLRLGAVTAAIRAADGFVAPLSTDVAYAVARGWTRDETALASGWGVTPEALHVTRADRRWGGRLAWCGTLIDRKGWRSFAVAFNEVADELDLTLEVFGARLPVDAVVPEVAAPVASRVHVHPLLPRSEQFVRLAACDLLVSTSVSEGWHFALQEAMAIGVPCAATRTGLLLELDNWGELVVPLEKRAPAQAADALRAVAEDPSTLEPRAARARALARSFSWERVAEATSRGYDRMLERRTRTRP